MGETPQDWMIRAEGVNFSATVFHTPNLAVIRGASATLETAMTLAASEALGAAAARGVSLLREETDALAARNGRSSGEAIYVGASQLAFRLSAATRTEALALAQALRDWLAQDETDPAKDPPMPPKHEMSILVDVAAIHPAAATAAEPFAHEFEAANRAQFATRYRQMRAPNFPGFDSVAIPAGYDKSQAVCPVDGRRPLGEPNDTVAVPADRYPAAPTVDGVGRRRLIRVSRNAKALMDYGRRQRTELYREFDVNLGEDDFVTDFEEIVADPPGDLSVSARSKMAVLYVDGAGFGDLRDEIAPRRGLAAFAGVAEGLMFKLLKEAVQRFAKGGVKRYRMQPPQGDWRTMPPLRFETLLRAGDEFTVVAPAWTAFELIRLWFAHAEEYAAKPEVMSVTGGKPLRLRIGCLICDPKTPIRRARSLAYLLQDEARGHESGGALIEVLESLEAPEPDEGFTEMRRARYGRANGALFSIPGKDFAAAEAHLLWLKERLPKAQLRRLIDKLEGVFPADANEAATQALTRSEAHEDVRAEHVLSPLLGYADGLPPAFAPKRIYELWDYALPLDPPPEPSP